MPPAVDATAQAVQLRGGPGAGPRAGRPSQGEGTAPAAEPSPERGEDASPAPLCRRAPQRPHRQRAPRAMRETAARLPGRPPPSVHLRPGRRSAQTRRAVTAPPSRALSRTRRANALVHAARPLFGPGSPGLEPMPLDVPASDVEELWSPALVVSRKKRKLKPEAFAALVFSVPKHGGPFSLGRGLISGRCFSRWASSFGSVAVSSPQTTKATSWVALAELLCACLLSARTSLRGHLRNRAGRRRS